MDVDQQLVELLLVLREVQAGCYGARLSEAPEGDLGFIHREVNAILDRHMALRKRVARLEDELEDALSKVEYQRAFMRELSSPMIEVWEGILCLPVIGMLDAERAAEMTIQLLEAIMEKRATHAIIDVTAVNAMEESTVGHFIRMARAIRLLGTKCVITGIQPGLARNLVALDINIVPVTTRRTLREALTAIMAERRQRDQSQPRSPADGGRDR